MNSTWSRKALLSFALTAAVVAEPIVKLDKSKVTYRGLTRDSVEDFHNMKFAHDTAGQRRFAPPELYTPPDGSVIDGTSHGPACPQYQAAVPPFFDETPDISEDCLHLRITRPAGTTENDRLPVVVHLVGGGVVKGSTYDSHVDPKNLVTHSMSLNKPIIHVAVNYRLTIFGFARLPILMDKKSLNVGMRDQRAGFEWVQKHISAFGGDSDRITSFGLSSGATFTSLHLMTFGGEQGVPFTQAWAMSGPPGTALNITSDATEIHTRAVAETTGCSLEDDQTSDEQILQCLRDVPMGKLLDVAVEYSQKNHPPLGLFTFIPSVDGDFLPDRQSKLYKTGKFVKGIPMVLGWTQDDGATNAGPAPAFQTQEDMKTPIKNFAHALTEEDYEHLFSLYQVADFDQDVRNYEARKSDSDPAAPVHYFRIARIMRDLLFTCSSIDFGFHISRQSKEQDPSFGGVRLYDLNQSMLTPMFHGAGMPWLGAIHGSDLDYLFNNVVSKEQMSDQDRRLAEHLQSSFINFAYTGDPNEESARGESLLWPEAFEETGEIIDLSHENPSCSSLDVQVIGGPLGTGSCHLAADVHRTEDLNKHQGTPQQPLVDSVQYGEMGSGASQERQKMLDNEKLIERCIFINSLAERLGH
ncbi:hypothetical protein DHEL01_v205498 [Diaporthe helianthi]|uniref:Carboxylesterase type B domain-containing protein n=1 Tax=Diaporthe helianthi TaxID=158607 RepID=A0A2P5I0Q8_DIAHE|nr:hypothetical protein DHEL01_v205498 [Diaporthe helianthi]